MKKNKILIFIFSLMFLFTGVVLAKENPFALNWQTKDNATSHRLVGLLNTNLSYGNEYVTIQLNMQRDFEQFTTLVKRYDQEGNILKSKTLNNKLVLEATTDGTYIYTLQMNPYSETDTLVGEYSEAEITIVKYDKDFNVEAEYTFSESDMEKIDESFLAIHALAKLFGYNVMNVVDNNIYFVQYGYGMLKIDTDLRKITSYNPNNDAESSRVQKYFPELAQTASLSKNMENGIISLDQNSNNIAYTSVSCIPDIATLLANSSEEVQAKAESTCDITGFIGLTDADGKDLWERELKNDIIAVNATLVGDYVVAIGISGDGSEVIIYDLNGDLVQTINSDLLGYSTIVPVNNGFMVNKNVNDFDTPTDPMSEIMTTLSEIGNKDELNQAIDDLAKTTKYALVTNTEIYQLPFKINVNVIGEGTVEANSEALANSEQSFKIDPKLGSRLKSIKITDANGNEIKYQDSKFTMPNSDVTIEVEFEAIIINPNTASVSIIGLLVVATTFGIITIRKYKKLKFLK